MNKNKLFLIIKREFLIRVKKKSFIIMTILTPLLLASMIFISVAISTVSSGGVQNIMVVDRSGIAEQYFVSNDKFLFMFDERADIDELKKSFSVNNHSAVVEISPLDANLNATVTVFSPKQLNLDASSKIRQSVRQALENNKLAKYDIANINEILEDIKSDVSVRNLVIGEDGKEKVGMVGIYMGVSYFLSFMIYMFIFLFGSMVMRGVIEEKTNRIVEIVISSVKPFQLMLGKILGIGSVALVQFLIWVVLLGGAFVGVTAMMGDESGVADMATTGIMSDSVIAGVSGEDIAEIAEVSEMSDTLNAFMDLPFAQILISFVIYFLLGYLLYASMFAAIGSAVDNEADTQQLVLPVTLPLIIGMFIMIHAFQYPDSQLSFWGSMIPFTSPMVMIARAPFGVDLWEYALSVGMLLLTFVFMTYISGKIYRVGILAYGKKATWKDMIKWIKY